MGFVLFFLFSFKKTNKTKQPVVPKVETPYVCGLEIHPPPKQATVSWRRLNFRLGQPTEFQRLRVLQSSWNAPTNVSEGPGKEVGWAKDGPPLRQWVTRQPDTRFQTTGILMKGTYTVRSG